MKPAVDVSKSVFDAFGMIAPVVVVDRLRDLLADEQEIDLMILDIMMKSGIDGLSAAGVMKRRHPETKIILTTSVS